jgi:hypothetical protein
MASDAPLFAAYLGAAATIGLAAYGIWALTVLLARKPETPISKRQTGPADAADR